MESRYRDRRDAGQQLAAQLTAYAQRPDVLVLALPRGGVPVAFEVASALQAPLDVCIVRSLTIPVQQLGIPGLKKLTIGAIAAGGIRVLNEEALSMLHIDMEVIDALTCKERRELEQREDLYYSGRSRPDVRDQTVILIDDGMNTGTVMRAAAQTLRLQHPARLVVAVPITAPSSCETLRAEVDEIICPFTPEYLFAIGFWYEDFFSQTSDREVFDLLGV
jgi:putative phosphoribosyl transferase